MPELVVVVGPDMGVRFPLAGPKVVVGRHSECGVALTDPQVSRQHFELRAAGTGYALTDLVSGNGTTVNGRPVKDHALNPGDRIGVGETLLEYRADDATTIYLPAADPGFPSAVLRTIPADAGSQILADPGRAGTAWLRTRLANLAVLYEAANAVSHILDVDELFGRILDLVRRTAGADQACALLTDPDTGALLPAVSRPAGAVISRTIVDHVLATGRGVLVSDAAADARFADAESVARHTLREVICVPMRGRHATVGVLFLDTTGGPTAFTEDHLHLAVAVAHQAALAVEETRHYHALVNAERLAAVGQTIAALSHHIKNIMQGVRFGGDMVRSAMTTDDRDLLGKGWRLVEKNQAKIDALILDMLSYSKEREPAAEPTDLPKLIADVLDVVRGRAADARVEIASDLASMPPVTCDPDGVHRAVLNLVSNAVDAAVGGRVTVELRAGGDAVEVIVSDTGPGVPAELRDDIFKPFVSTKGSRGTGLGLPVSRKIAREHGGDLTVEDAPGGGARFVLRLPVAR